MRATPSCDSSVTPWAVPPQAVGVWQSATERALPCPPAAGISARRQSLRHEKSAVSAGLAKVR